MNPKINVNALRIGYYSDKYFLRTQEILTKDNYEGKVHYQYFPRKDCIVCGIPQVIQILKECVGYFENRERAWNIFSEMQKIDIYKATSVEEISHFVNLRRSLDEQWISKYDELKVYAIEEGTNVKDMEPVIGIIGNPKYFIHLETPTLGVLAQQSSVATSVHKAKSLLKSNQNLLFFPARFRHFLSQAADGYSATVGGGNFLSTDANGEYWGYDGIGTIPHALIAAYGGNTPLAALKFDEMIDPKVGRSILVDWDNDCIGTTLRVVAAFYLNTSGFKNLPTYKDSYEEIISNSAKAEHFIRDHRHWATDFIGEGKGRLAAVRFDTSGSLTDSGISPWGEKGVCSELVWTARRKFDDLGLNDLKIIVSGGFDEEKLKKFKEVPYDMVGIGSSIVNKFTVDFTADAVTLNDKPNAKVGRGLLDWKKLNPVIE